MGIQTYAVFLSSTAILELMLTSGVDSDQRRIQQLENARKLSLDIPNIIRRTMKITLEKTAAEMEELFAEQGQPILAAALTDPLTSLDEIQIRAVEWVLVGGAEELNLDALKIGDVVFRRFLRMFVGSGDLHSGGSSKCGKGFSGTRPM